LKSTGFMGRKIPGRGFDVGLQIYWMQQQFPQFQFNFHAQRWQGTLQPTGLSPAYMVAIRYRGSKTPKVFVIAPEIHARAPHRYSDNTLCLHYPPDHDWRADSIVALTIVPWIAEWLFFYECWLDTGKWAGEAVSHSGEKKTD